MTLGPSGSYLGWSGAYFGNTLQLPESYFRKLDGFGAQKLSGKENFLKELRVTLVISAQILLETFLSYVFWCQRVFIQWDSM